MKLAAVVVVLAIVFAFSFQFKTISALQAEVARLRAQVEAPSAPDGSVQAPANAPTVSLGSLPRRVTALEQTVGELAKAADILAERGVVPPTPEHIEQMQARFFDASATERDRLRALQLIRRNGAVSEQVVATALDWLQTSTNANTRRNLLRQLDGLTNSTLKQPLLALLGSEANGGVREELVDALAVFVDDPAVEQRIWDLALNDPESDVREQAEEALTEGRMTPERIASLQSKASSADLPLEARLLALRGLNEADVQAPEVLAEFANMANQSTDPVTRARLFEAFDGINDPSLMLPLVNGLQDPNPIVRQRAADALSSFGSDERIQQWLQHVAQNDLDPRVKREAFQALEQSQRRRPRQN